MGIFLIIAIKCSLLHKDSIKKHILSQALKKVKKEDQDSFVEDVLEDLKEIDQSRIVGIGITPEQLNAWMKKQL